MECLSRTWLDAFCFCLTLEDMSFTYLPRSLILSAVTTRGDVLHMPSRGPSKPGSVAKLFLFECNMIDCNLH